MPEPHQNKADESDLSTEPKTNSSFTEEQKTNLLQIDPSQARSSYEKLGKVAGHLPANE